jgi:hypothetical protein
MADRDESELQKLRHGPLSVALGRVDRLADQLE